MADQVDRAQEIEDMMWQEALHDHRCRARLILGDRDRRRPSQPPDSEPGACVDCGDDIPAERMAALPEAVRCIDCQAFWERWT